MAIEFESFEGLTVASIEEKTMQLKSLVTTLLVSTFLQNFIALSSYAQSAQQLTSQQIIAKLQPTLRDFKKVENTKPGITIYRGGHPDAGELALLSQLGIKTIISLQGDPGLPIPSERESAQEEERAKANELGMNFFQAPTTAVIPMDTEAKLILLQAVQMMGNPELQPIYIHCSLGNDRTGLGVALHRVLNEGWNAKSAYEEMKDNGHQGIQRMFTGHLKGILFDAAAGKIKK